MYVSVIVKAFANDSLIAGIEVVKCLHMCCRFSEIIEVLLVGCAKAALLLVVNFCTVLVNPELFITQAVRPGFKFRLSLFFSRSVTNRRPGSKAHA